jgi:glycosyltransferase 2 family protein
MLPKLRKLLFVGLSIGLGLGLMYWLIGSSDLRAVWESFRQISVGWVMLLLAVSFCFDLCLAWRWQVILRYHGHRIAYKTCLRYRLMGSSVSYITPSARLGGEAVRAIMLTRHNISSTDAFSSVILDKTLEMTSNIFFGAIGMLIVVLTFKVPALAYGLMTAAFFLTMALIITFFRRLARKDKMFIGIGRRLGILRFRFGKKLFHKLDLIEERMSEFMAKSYKGFIYAVVLSALMWIVLFATYWLALYMVGYSATLLQIYLVAVFIGIAYILPVPAALGTLEGGQVTLWELLGQGSALGIAFGLLIRGLDMLKAAIGLSLFFHSGMNVLSFFKNGKARH